MGCKKEPEKGVIQAGITGPGGESLKVSVISPPRSNDLEQELSQLKESGIQHIQTALSENNYTITNSLSHDEHGETTIYETTGKTPVQHYLYDFHFMSGFFVVGPHTVMLATLNYSETQMDFLKAVRDAFINIRWSNQ